MTSADPTDSRRYTDVARVLHWAIAALIVCQFVLANAFESAEEAGQRLGQLALLANHKSVGMTVLMLAVLRLGWRLTHRPPALPASMAGWQVLASKATHVAIYGLIFLIPLTGWLQSSAKAYSVSWFNLFAFPDLVGKSERIEGLTHELHEIGAKLLVALVIVHVLAALKHHFLDKDGVLKAMATPMGWGLFAVILGGSAVTLTQVPGTSAATTQTAPATPAATPEPSAAAARPSGPADAMPNDDAEASTAAPMEAETPALSIAGVTDDAAAAAPDAAAPSAVTDAPAPPALWKLDAANSHIRFTAEQAGAPFTGTWPNWEADIRFDAARPERSSAVVTIRVGTVDTDDRDRDETMKGAEWFASATYPTAIFKTERIERADTGFVATATLTIKGEPRPVTFTFDVEETDGATVLTGTARLDRLALGLGTGDWTDTTWVGQFVDVEVLVRKAP